MSGANADLRGQRDVIISVADKNQNIQKNLKQGKIAINQISKQEFKQRAMLYFAIFVLFITDVALLIALISRTISGGQK